MALIRNLTVCIVAGILFVLPACNQGNKSEHPSGEKQVEIGRLEHFIYTDTRPDSPYVNSLAAWGEIVGADLLCDSIYRKYSGSAPVQVFTPDVEAVFPETEELSIRLGEFENNIAELLPEVPSHTYFTVVSPYMQSIYLYADSIVFIALNHYLGADYEGYAGRFADYEKQTKEASRIPADVARAVVVSAYPYFIGDNGGSVVSRMLYEGAVAEVLMRLMPYVSAAEALGYTDEEYEWLQANENYAWQALVGKGLLYSASPTDMMRLFSPSPSTAILHPSAPGMAGRYFGYRIVKKYIESKHDAEMSFLLSPAFYADDRTFANIGYIGR